MKKYVSAIYIRLSLEDNDKYANEKDESNSVKNQRDLINRYIRNSYDLCDSEVIEFCDDGYTGTNLDRPALQDMLNKVNEGSINCILVKDFSRFARDHIEVGHYIEEYFPCLGVRFISVNDGYDSVDFYGATPDMSFGFVTLLHEMYSHDLSQKVKSAKRTRAKMGKFLNPYAPFGYVKSAGDRNKLEVDEDAAKIVRRIFQMKLDGKSAREIARILNHERVLTPGEYKFLNGRTRKWKPLSEYVFWDTSNINVILHDERYVGSCVYGKRERFEVGSASTRPHPKSEWIIVKNTHEAIITKDDFDAAQKMFKKSKKARAKTKIKTPLTERIRCGGCYHKLEALGIVNTVLFCKTPSVYNGRDCFRGKLDARDTEDTILLLLKTHMKMLITFGERFVKQESKPDKPNNPYSLEKAIDKLKSDRVEYYELYKEGKISEDEYTDKREAVNSAIKSFNKEIETGKAQDSNEAVTNSRSLSIIEAAKKYIDTAELTKEAIETFVDCIYVNNDNTIEVVWSFNDIIENIQNTI